MGEGDLGGLRNDNFELRTPNPELSVFSHIAVFNLHCAFTRYCTWSRQATGLRSSNIHRKHYLPPQEVESRSSPYDRRPQLLGFSGESSGVIGSRGSLRRYFFVLSTAPASLSGSVNFSSDSG